MVVIPRVPRVVRETEHGATGHQESPRALAQTALAGAKVASRIVDSRTVIARIVVNMSVIAIVSRTVTVIVIVTATVTRIGAVATRTDRADRMIVIRAVASAPVTRIGIATADAEHLRSDW